MNKIITTVACTVFSMIVASQAVNAYEVSTHAALSGYAADHSVLATDLRCWAILGCERMVHGNSKIGIIGVRASTLRQVGQFLL